MPSLSGSLIDVTSAPSDATEVWIRAADGRVSGANVVLEETRRVPVNAGKFTVTVLPGRAHLVVIHAGMSQEHVPLLVQDGMTTIAEAVRLGSEDWEEYSPSQAEQIKADLAAEVTKAATSAQAAKTAQQAADGHANRAESAADTAAGETVTQVRSEFEGMLADAESARDAAATSETNAAQSKQDAAQSASAAAMSASQAAENATSAAQDASRAETARAEAVQAQAGAEQAESNAAASEQAAATSASNAATSAANAQDSATAAATSTSEAAAHADRAEQASDPAGLRDEITQQIADLVDGAPEYLDTIREVAEYAQENRDITDALNAAIGNKADKVHTHTTSQVTGLDAALGAKLDASKLQVVTAMPNTPVAGTIYYVTGA